MSRLFKPKKVLPLLAAVPGLLHAQPPDRHRPVSGFFQHQGAAPYQYKSFGLHTVPWRLPFNLTSARGLIKCMEEAENPAAPAAPVAVPAMPNHEALFGAVRDLYQAIPDPSLVSVRELRERLADSFGLEKEGLDDQRELIKRFATIIINDENPPEFRDGMVVAADAPAVPVPMSFARAAAASLGLVPRKVKARFAPWTAPNIDFQDLTLMQFHGRNPTKAVVDIIAGYRGNIDQDFVKKCVIDGEMEKLPEIARPPATAIACNHFTQTVFVGSNTTAWNIARFITFQSEGGDGKATPAVASSHCHGEPNLVNYGSNNKTSKRVFLFLSQELGGMQIRQWELQSSSAAPLEETPGDDEIKAIDEGFKFIEKSWREKAIPAHGITQLHWVTRQLKDKDSPLYAIGPFRWTDRLVEKAIKKLTEDGCLAAVNSECPYTIQTLAPWLVDDVLVHIVPHLTKKSLGMAGKAGIGKTPVLEAIACVLSRYWN